MRRIVICICLFTVLFQGMVTPVWAKDQDKKSQSGIIGKQVDEYYADPENKPGLLERSISDVLIGCANFLIESFGMKDVTLLVFGKNPNPAGDGFLQGGSSEEDLRSGLYLGVFTEGMMSAIDALYSTFERFMPYPVVLAVLLIAALLLFQSMSSDGRSKGKDYMAAFLIGLLSIRFGHYLWMLVSYVTQKFTDMIWATMVDHGLQPDLFLNMIWGNGAEGYGEMIQYRGFVVSVLVLLAAIMTAFLNYQYTMRTIMLMILVSTFVISAVLTIFPKFRHSLQTWWDVFITQMIMPCAHGLALGLFFLLLRYSSDDVSNWVIVAYLFGFSSINSLVNRLFGGSESQSTSRLGNMLGIGSMMALGRMFRAKGKGSNQNAKSRSGGPDSGVDGSSFDTSSNAVTPAYSANGATASSSPSWKGKALRAGGKAARFALNYGSKTAGVVAGTSIGLMAGNPLMGASIGAKVGGWAGKGAEGLAKGGMWLGSKAAGRVQGLRANKATANSLPEEAMTEEGMTQSTPPIDLIVWDAKRSTRNQGAMQSPVHPSSPGVTSSAGAVSGAAAGASGGAVVGVAGTGSSGAGLSTKTGTTSNGGINSEKNIASGKVSSDTISVSNNAKDMAISNPDNYNRGNSGGNVKAKSIKATGGTSGQGVRITDSHAQAERITPNTNLRQTERPKSEPTHGEASEASNTGNSLPGSSGSDQGSTSQAEKPFTPSGGRHYNYYL
ncbi:hypothetical protein J1TS5_04130 [Paenibacillus macerans]|uniref:hypothetical protein n=1 Tax=Paenibacillus macerans TaxID=44252 RepID=UPI001B030269|nr:hypothetical protein [Paenibacillus macerans]GIP08243.1 hypothetical protein J1TS5_04130 [Paenibacillus macerans]